MASVALRLSCLQNNTKFPCPNPKNTPSELPHLSILLSPLPGKNLLHGSATLHFTNTSHKNFPIQAIKNKSTNWHETFLPRENKVMSSLKNLFTIAKMSPAMCISSGSGAADGSAACPRPIFRRSSSIGILHGGNLALERLKLVESGDCGADLPSLEDAEGELDYLLKEDRPSFKSLQTTIVKLEMSGKEDQAVKKLEAAVQKAERQKKSQERYEFEMLLVEMLIYKGDFNRALTCKCLYENANNTDARRPLYMAVIYLLLGRPEEEAKRYWEQFMNTKEYDFLNSPPNLDDDEDEDDKITININVEEIEGNDFEEFKRVVKILKDEIRKARAQKK